MYSLASDGRAPTVASARARLAEWETVELANADSRIRAALDRGDVLVAEDGTLAVDSDVSEVIADRLQFWRFAEGRDDVRSLQVAATSMALLDYQRERGDWPDRFDATAYLMSTYELTEHEAADRLDLLEQAALDRDGRSTLRLVVDIEEERP